MIEGAIFDVDGTLLDSMSVWHNCGVRFLEKLGIEAEPGLGDFLFTQTNESGAIYMVDRYELSLDPEDVAAGMSEDMENYYFNNAALKAGAIELLDSFKAAGIPMTVASSTDRYLLEGAFDKLDLGRYFEGIISCGELGATKSDPVVFDKAAEIIGTAPEGTWVFEDGLYAVKTAHDAGYKTVAVYDELSKDDFDEMKELADFHVERLDEFIDYIERLD